MAQQIITFNSRDVQNVIRGLPQKLVIPATVRALNKVPANVRATAVSAIRERRGLPAGAIRKAMRIIRATRTKLTSSLVVTGKPIGLKDYKARQTRKGVTVVVTKGQRKLIPSAFIVQKLSGHVFTRTSKKRLPIEKMVGPSLPATFLHTEVRKAWIGTAREALLNRLKEEVHYELLRLRAPRVNITGSGATIS